MMGGCIFFHKMVSLSWIQDIRNNGLDQVCQVRYHFWCNLRRHLGCLIHVRAENHEVIASMYYHRHGQYVFLKLCMLLTLMTASLSLDAAVVTVYWAGHISSVTSFNQNAVPVGIAQGGQITGSLIFESSQFTSNSDILGNYTSGEEYRYSLGLIQTINIATWEWKINGADVSLLNNVSFLNLLIAQQVFDVYSTSENYSFNSFPNYVGSFEYGFALFDENVPLQLFDSYQAENVTLDLDQVTHADGFLTTRHGIWAVI